MFQAIQVVRGNKEKPVHTGLYLVRKGMRLDGATLSFFISIFILYDSVNSNHSEPSDLVFLLHFILALLIFFLASLYITLPLSFILVSPNAHLIIFS
jgi:hypothetical protein